MMKNEKALVSRVAIFGDKKAFNQLLELYQSPIRRFLYNLTGGNEELSKDLAQDTFVKVWLKIASFRALSKFSTWLYRIAYNTFYDHIRSNKHHIAIDEEIANNHAISGNHDHDLKIDFIQALKILKEEERTAMLLFYMEDLTVEKISTIMNRSSGTIKSHLHRRREKLSVYFRNQDITN